MYVHIAPLVKCFSKAELYYKTLELHDSVVKLSRAAADAIGHPIGGFN